MSRELPSGQQDNLRLGIHRTFFHVTDDNEEAEIQRLRRVKSESSLYSSNSTSSTSESRSSHGLFLGSQAAAPAALVLVQLQSDRDSTMWSERSGSASAKTKGSHDDASNRAPDDVASYHLPSWLQEGQGMFRRGYPAGSSEEKPHLYGSAGDIPEYHLLKGAELHSVGQCKPCAWLWGKKGCANGMDCDFCHVSIHAKNHKNTTSHRKQYMREKAEKTLRACAQHSSGNALAPSTSGSSAAQGSSRNSAQSSAQTSSAVLGRREPMQRGTFSM